MAKDKEALRNNFPCLTGSGLPGHRGIKKGHGDAEMGARKRDIEMQHIVFWLSGLPAFFVP